MITIGMLNLLSAANAIGSAITYPAIRVNEGEPVRMALNDSHSYSVTRKTKGKWLVSQQEVRM